MTMTVFSNLSTFYDYFEGMHFTGTNCISVIQKQTEASDQRNQNFSYVTENIQYVSTDGRNI